MERTHVESRISSLTRDAIGENYENGLSFTEMGMDSLDQVELIMSVEKEFDVNVPDETLWELIDTMDEQVLSGIVCRLLGVE